MLGYWKPYLKIKTFNFKITLFYVFSSFKNKKVPKNGNVPQKQKQQQVMLNIATPTYIRTKSLHLDLTNM
jgi:hypothetical protein